MSEQEEFEFRLRLEKEREAPQVQEEPQIGLGEFAKKFVQQKAQSVGNLMGGSLRGAGSIGATLLEASKATPTAVISNFGRNIATGRDVTDIDLPSLDARSQRLSDMEGGLRSMGVDTDSTMFKVGKLGTEIAGTSGVGGLLGNLTARAPVVSSALSSGGFNLGRPAATTALGKIGDLAIRSGAGATVGGVSTAMVDPENWKTGALIGGVLPAAVSTAGLLGDKLRSANQWIAEKLMNSALKPSKAAHKSGDAKAAVRTMLDRGVNVSKGGLEKLEGAYDQTNQQIADAIQNSSATINKNSVLNRLGDTRAEFIKDVSPAAPLGQIDDVAAGFRNHPIATGDDIPVQLAQELKRGTYRTLKKSYGEMKGAETEARKALARGLKEEIADAVPGLKELNKQDQDLIRAMKVLEDRVLMDANKNPVGLGALAPNKTALLMWLADRNAMAKSLMARGLNSSANMQIPNVGLLGNELPVLLSSDR